MNKKSIILTLFFIVFSLVSTQTANAQILKKVKKAVKSTAESRVVNEAANVTNKAFDKTKKKAGDAVNGENPGGKDRSGEDGNTPIAAGDNQTTMATYKSYDFVPGDKIIFEPDMSDEPDAELPARFIIKSGNAEIQSYNGDKILHIDKGGYATVAPLMKEENYLPDQFTLEFDMMYENDADYFRSVNDFKVQFFASDDNTYDNDGLFSFLLHSGAQSSLGKRGTRRSELANDVKEALNKNYAWHHLALYFNKNIGKVYINGTRVQASNNLPAGAAKFAIMTDGRYGFKIKNMRLAAGGEDKYKKVVTDGKFITHGILFDVNKATIKPESMGTLNEIVKLMKAHDDLKFEIVGNTDSDGSTESNLKLSSQRAEAVKAKLAQMGISESRFTTKGNGEANPIDTNDTAEGKANNRRVEFVKI